MDHDPNTSSSTSAKGGSYRDKLIGVIQGAFEQAFGFSSFMQEDSDSDTEVEEFQGEDVRIIVSKEEKARIRAPWHQTLIVKTFGRTIGFHYLSSRISAMWKPNGSMECIDLGFDFYLVKFSLAKDVDRVLKEGPWFIGQHFLATRQWETDFKASTATLSSVAVWIRLPELPIEYYDHDMPLKIGKVVGPVLRLDSNTAMGARVRFARLCVQVNLDKPLIKRVHTGKNVLSIQYEGINSLCFSCGRVRHRKEACPFIIRENLKEKVGMQEVRTEANTATQDSQEQQKV